MLWLLPRDLRTAVNLKWFLSLIVSIARLHNIFLSFRSSTLYWLGINSQVCFMEKMLNDRYDNNLRRIYIANPQTFDPLFIYERAELKPVPLFEESENKPIFLNTRAETLLGGTDFIVVLPLDLVANIDEMNALINKHKLPDKLHAIQRL